MKTTYIKRRIISRLRKGINFFNIDDENRISMLIDYLENAAEKLTINERLAVEQFVEDTLEPLLTEGHWACLYTPDIGYPSEDGLTFIIRSDYAFDTLLYRRECLYKELEEAIDELAATLLGERGYIGKLAY